MREITSPTRTSFDAVLLGERKEHRVADQLNVPGRIVLVVLDVLELKQVQRDLVVDQTKSAAACGLSAATAASAGSVPPRAIELLLGCHACGLTSSSCASSSMVLPVLGSVCL